MKAVLQLVLRMYKRWISPALPASCRYVPSCSEYAMEAIERHGAMRGGALTIWRVLRCHPFAKGGYDPVSAAIRHKGCGPAMPAGTHGRHARATKLARATATTFEK